GYFKGLTEYQPRPIWELPGLLWNLAIHGLHFGSGIDVLGDFGWAPLIALLPCLWLVRKESSAVALRSIYSVLFFIPWGLSRPVLRFLLPLAPVLALLAAQGWVHGARVQTKFFGWAGRFFLGSLFI